MSILLTGGTGKTGAPLAQLLHAHGKVPFVIASRSGNVPTPFHSVHFDWKDPSTYENPFNPALLPPGTPPIDRVYLVGPDNVESPSIIKDFVDFAIGKGVKRFVLLSGTPYEPGGIVMGKLHQYLVDSGVDYCVLRPSWFMENLSTYRAGGIKNNDTVYSAAGDGKIGFIATEDIAQLAFEALVDDKSHNTEHIMVGPEFLTYDEIARILSTVLARPITHKRLSRDEFKQHTLNIFLSPTPPAPMAEEHATMLADWDVEISKGSEARWVDSPRKWTGKVSFAEFAERNKAVWERG